MGIWGNHAPWIECHSQPFVLNRELFTQHMTQFKVDKVEQSDKIPPKIWSFLLHDLDCNATLCPLGAISLSEGNLCRTMMDGGALANDDELKYSWLQKQCYCTLISTFFRLHSLLFIYFFCSYFEGFRIQLRPLIHKANKKGNIAIGLSLLLSLLSPWALLKQHWEMRTMYNLALFRCCFSLCALTSCTLGNAHNFVF